MELTIFGTDKPNKPLYQSSGKDIIIGRPKDIPLHLDLSPDLKVSRPHSHLYYHLSTWWVRDLDSKHGTFLNGVKIDGETPLFPGDELRLGETTLRVEFFSTETQDFIDFQVDNKSPADEILLPQTISEDRHTELFAGFSIIAANYPNGETMLVRFLEEIRNLFPKSDHISIVVIDKDNELIPRASWPKGPAHFSFTLVRQAIVKKEILHWVRDISIGNGIASSLFETTTVLCAPLLFNGQVIGAIYLDQTRLDGAFSQQDRDLLSEVANLIAAPLKAVDSKTFPSYPTVFISYLPDDRELVDRLAKNLRRHRVKVWFDERLQVGDDRQQLVKTAIQTTDAFIPVLTSDGLENTQVQWELSTALKLGKKILPLRYDSNALPKAIEHLVCLDISSQKLQESITDLVGIIYKFPRNVQFYEPQTSASRISLRKRDPNRILVLAANPKNTKQLRLGKESRTIEESLRIPNDRFELQWHGAVRIKDLSKYLLRHKPNILHFSGHGNKIGKVIFEDEIDKGKTITDQAIRRMLQLFKNDLRLVVLNACLTASQASEIINAIDCVVGMSDKIEDEAAINFARGFYRAIADHQNIEFAFELGCSEIGLENIGEESKPQLFVKEGVDPGNIIFD